MPLDPAAGWAPDLAAAPRDTGAALPQLPLEPVRGVRAGRASSTRRSSGPRRPARSSCTTSRTATSSSTGGGRESFLATPGAREVGVELFSMSKSYGMAGWRLGFVLGNAEIVSRVDLLQDHLRRGSSARSRRPGSPRSPGPQDTVEERRALYEARRDRVARRRSGHTCRRSRCDGSFFVWLRLPEGVTADDDPRGAARRARAGRGLRRARPRLGADLARDAGRAARPRARAARRRVRLHLEQASRRTVQACRRRSRRRRSAVLIAAGVLLARASRPRDVHGHARAPTRRPAPARAAHCTLREAIRAANASVGVADTVVLPSTKPYMLAHGRNRRGRRADRRPRHHERSPADRPSRARGQRDHRRRTRSTASSRSSWAPRRRSRSSSSATGTPTGANGYGGGIRSYARLTLISTTVTRQQGRGLRRRRSTSRTGRRSSCAASTVTNNRADGDGGGISASCFGGSGAVTIRNSTVIVEPRGRRRERHRARRRDLPPDTRAASSPRSCAARSRATAPGSEGGGIYTDLGRLRLERSDREREPRED